MKHRAYHTLFVLLLLAISICGYANSIDHDLRLWSKVTYVGRLDWNPRIRYKLGIHLRFRNDITRFHQFRIEPAMGYQLTPRVTVWASYIAKPFLSSSNELRYEHRIRQYLTWRILSRRHFILSSRTRMEERKEHLEPLWAYRFRERLSLFVPKLFHNAIGLITSNELYFNLNHPKWVSDRRFSENLFYVGLQFPIKSRLAGLKNASLQVGYYNELQFSSSSTRMNHIISFSLVVPV